MIFSILAIILVIFLLFLLTSVGFTFYLFKTKNSYFQEMLNNMLNRPFKNPGFNPGFRQSGDELSYEEALEILCIDKSADKKNINRAYHKMMQNLHPDKGGSSYFARKLTQAREIAMKYARS